MTDIEGYWKTGFPNVEGWVHGGLLPYVQLIGRVQAEASIRGHIAEIGVYHGKFLIALSHLAAAGDKVTALDVFDDQGRNVDGAGKGDLEILKTNISLHAPGGVEFDFIKADSLALTLLDKVNLTRTNGPFRLFSVDGCHTREHTLNDLVTASECIAAGGVIILDDFMQPHWPGVTEAVNDFCRGNHARMKPFLYAYHKLFFVGFGWHAPFFNACLREFGQHPAGKVVEMFGSRVFSVYP